MALANSSGMPYYAVEQVNTDVPLKYQYLPTHKAVTSHETILFIFLSVRLFPPRARWILKVGPVCCYCKYIILILTLLVHKSSEPQRMLPYFETVHNKIFQFQQQYTPQNVSHILFSLLLYMVCIQQQCCKLLTVLVQHISVYSCKNVLFYRHTFISLSLNSCECSGAEGIMYILPLKETVFL
jgi:hypothetical protein